jgi:hypothetical protein
LEERHLVGDLLKQCRERGEQRLPVVLLIEVIHWADSATLDLLTYVRTPAAESGLVLAVTCRGDEASMHEQVVDWLAHVRRSAAIAELRRPKWPSRPRAWRVLDERFVSIKFLPYVQRPLHLTGHAGGDRRAVVTLPRDRAGVRSRCRSFRCRRRHHRPGRTAPWPRCRW